MIKPQNNPTSELERTKWMSEYGIAIDVISGHISLRSVVIPEVGKITYYHTSINSSEWVNFSEEAKNDIAKVAQGELINPTTPASPSELPEKLRMLFDGLLKREYIDKHHVLMVENEYAKALKAQDKRSRESEREKKSKYICGKCSSNDNSFRYVKDQSLALF